MATPAFAPGAPLTIGRLFHVLHASNDFDELDAFYERVFTPWHGMMERSSSPSEGRVGSLLVIGDAVVEIAAPSDDPGAASAPIGRFVARFGPRWHSIAWFCDDVGQVAARLMGAGLRVLLAGGAPAETPPTEGGIYTHPKDTGTQLEFYQPPATHGGPGGPGPFPDPRFSDDWMQRWAARENPLGVEGLAHVTVVVRDLERAVGLWRDVLGAPVVSEEISPLAGTRSVYVALGTGPLIELATPTGSDSLAAADLAARGDTCHAVTFRVVDPDRAAGHLQAAGVGVLARDETTILADPADTLGAAMRFSAGGIPRDPP